MGEVYRAHDSRLRRDVAIKVLRRESNGQYESRAHLEREARSVAALNHPNIVSIYEFGSHNGQHYIVSELVGGESLRNRIRRSDIELRELYRIAVQLADGMAAAHAAGIIHRDLKPENVMLTVEARVKILDFGIARRTGKPVANSPDETAQQFSCL